MRGWVLSRVLGLGAVVAVAGACGVGSESGAGGSSFGPEPGGLSYGTALRARFPALAPAILEADEAFVASPEGFTLRPANGPGTWRSVDVTLPTSAAGAIRVRAPGFEVRVREVGATGETTLATRAAAYARTGGRSFWTVAGGAVEEWLHLEPGVAHADRAAAAWEVEGAALRKTGEVVEALDQAGVPRLRVTAPVAYAAGGRQVPLRLEVRGARIELTVDANGEEVLVDPSWSTTTSMVTPRMWHTATLLPGGDVLVTGGINNVWELSNLERYSAASGTWSQQSMAVPRYHHTAALLQNGKVLVCGGSSANSYTATCDLYDPASGSLSAAASMSVPRSSGTMTTLADGRVLMTGGWASSGLIASAELYNPTTNTWSAAGTMSLRRYRHTATQLGSGKVLIAGGITSGSRAAAELYDPATNTWTATGSLTTGRGEHTAARLGDGTVLVAAGADSAGELSSAEIYNPATGTWAATGGLSAARIGHAMSALGNGKVLLTGGNVGGTSLSGAEIYDPASRTWAAAPSMPNDRYNHASTSLANGTVLVTGGSSSVGTRADAAIFDALTLANGAACAGGNQCISGSCVDGVCCNTACGGGSTSDCQACSVAAGAAQNGVCGPTTGNTCDDGNPSTSGDVCSAGVCAGVDRCLGVVCTASDACHTAGTCNPQTGACSNPAKADGSTCNDGDPCTQVDTCQAGVCTGGSPVTCAPLDACHAAGTCDPQTGACSSPAKADGSACNDGNPCTQVDTCQAGVCTGGSPVTCTPQDACHLAGTCDPQTGACSNPPNPACSPTCITLQRGVLGNAYDALVNAASPTKNYGGTQSLTASTGSAGLRYGLLRFDLSPIPAGATITTATLRLTVMLTGGAGPLALHRVTAPWSESSVTWASFASAFSPNVEASLPAVALPTADLQALVQAWVSGAAPNHGVLIERTADGSTILASSEFIPSQQPRLDVCYLP